MLAAASVGVLIVVVVLWIVMIQPAILVRWRLALLSVAFLAIGLLPYAYLPIYQR